MAVSLVTEQDVKDAVGGDAEYARICRKAGGDTNKFNKAKQRAETEVHAAAEGTDDYPWTAAPEAAKAAALALCLYYLYALSWPASAIPVAVRDGYKDEKAKLAEMAKGKTSWIEGSGTAEQRQSDVYAFLPGDDKADDNPRSNDLGTLRRLF